MGTIFLWFPTAATVLLSLVGSIASRQFLFDYLMPAELSLFAIIGAGLLLWAAIRVRSKVWWVVVGLVLMVLMLLGSQGLAVVSGLASGDTPPSGGIFIVVVSMLALHALLQMALAVTGIFLSREIRGGEQTAPASTIN